MIQDLPEDLITTTEDILHEARRNPDQNPRIGPLTRLEEYKDDPNIFISFTEIDKAGLKPLSDYNTPLGIYCYPLKISWDYYGVDRALETFKRDLEMGSSKKLPPSKLVKAERRAIQNAFPFATQNPYIQVIRAKKPLTNISKINQREVDKTIDQIKDILFEISANSSVHKKSDIEEAFDMLLVKSVGNPPGRQLWYLTNYLTGGRHVNPPTSSYLISQLFLDQYRTKSPMRAWNYLLRDLGFNGFVDEGNSIIHENEPVQSVFLHRGAFKKVDRVLNKPSVLSQKKKKIGTWMNDNKISKDAKWYIQREATKDTPAYIRWKSGTFIDGVWKRGSWEDGVWENGVWVKGIWEKGIWKRGKWIGGEIFSERFLYYIYSRVDPNEFKEIEAEVDNLAELRERVKNP